MSRATIVITVLGGGVYAQDFQTELCEYYQRLIARNKWQLQSVSANDLSRTVIIDVEGPACYRKLQKEAGVHKKRIRVENNRIHTSAVALAVLDRNKQPFIH